MADTNILKHLPLTEATYYILLALVAPKHGYAVMQDAEDISQGTIRLAPGTLYGALSTLENNGLISMVGKEGRRKIYQITETGIRVLLGQIQRMEIMLQSAAKNFDLWQERTAEEESHD
ncbi:MAG: PadR family transcriptional regulator [Bacteroidetes bacterium]|nr:MAG: PadR family transcriptional regulator [Bacteroidota bacterium]